MTIKNTLYINPCQLGLVLIYVLIASCKPNTDLFIPEEKAPLSQKKEITSVNFNNQSLNTSNTDITTFTDTILITVPASTDLNDLIPVFTIQAKSISPESGKAQNFSQPVNYTLTAVDGTKKVYSIKVNKSKQMIYIGSNDSFYALDPVMGKLVWKIPAKLNFAYSSPTYSNGIIYAGCIDNNLYAFDAGTGAVKWKYEIMEHGIESPSTVASGKVFFGGNDDYMYALDASTGEFKWKFKTGGNVSTKPAIHNGVMYFGSSDGKIYALNIENGASLWTLQTGSMINASSPCILNNVVYVGNRDGNLYAINAASGIIKWTYSTSGLSLEMSSPVISKGILYISSWYDSSFSQKGSLYAINAVSGSLIWKVLPLGFSNSPAVAKGRVFVSADGGDFYAINRDNGTTIWNKKILPNGADASIANDVVYVGGGGTGNIYAFDAETGTEKWRYPITGLMTSKPCIIGKNGEISED